MKLRLFFVLIVTVFRFPCLAAQTTPPDFFAAAPGEIAISVSDENLATLRQTPRKDVPASLSAFGKEWSPTSVHLKGHSTFQSVDQKPSLTVRFAGTKIHLNNSADDPSYLNEFIGAHIFNLAKIHAPRVSHCRLVLNGRDLGPYVVTEGISDPHIDVPDSVPTTWEGMQSFINVDTFARFIALEVMMCHWDGYALRSNNFRISKDSGGRFVFNPAGMDQLFGKSDFPWNPVMTPTLAQQFMTFKEGQALYKRAFQKCFEENFNVKELTYVMHKQLDSVQPLLSAIEFSELKNEEHTVMARIAQRRQFLERVLSKTDNPPDARSDGWKNADFRRPSP